MDKIPNIPTNIDLIDYQKPSKLTKLKGLIQYAGLLVGMFIVFACMIILSTDIDTISIDDMQTIGISFFVLVIATYLVYISCADSGKRNGLLTEEYKKTIEKFNSLKEIIVTKGYQYYIPQFCKEYVEQEFNNARKNLLEPLGIKYEDFLQLLEKMPKRKVKKQNFSKLQKNAILKARKLKPMELKPEMIYQTRFKVKRNLIADNPQSIKTKNYTSRFFKILIFSLVGASVSFTPVVIFDASVLATMLFKLISIISNGYFGYRFGYDNIVSDTCDYIDSKCDLMQQIIKYCEKITINQ